MRSGPPKVVLDPYEWLPGYGETSLEVSQHGGEWRIRVFYDSADQTALVARDICFFGVYCFHHAALPGVHLLHTGLQGLRDNHDKLLEFPMSEAASAWSQHFGYRKIRHYWIHFAAGNCDFEVFADGVRLTDPTILKHYE